MLNLESINHDLIDDHIANILSRIASFEGVAMPKHRFIMSAPATEQNEASHSLSFDLNLKIREIWSTLFPDGEAYQLIESPQKTSLPVLWISNLASELKILKGLLSDGNFSCEDVNGAEEIFTKENLGNGTLLVLKTRHSDHKDSLRPKTARQWFYYAIRKRKTPFLEGILATSLISILTLGVSFFSMQVYDRVVPTASYSTLIVITVGALLAIFLELITKQIRSNIIDRACKLIDIELSGVFFSKMLSVRMDARPNSVGTFASQIKQFELVRNFMTSTTLFILADIPFVIFFIVVIGLIGGIVALVPLALVPLSLFSGFYAKWKLGDLAEKQLEDSNLKNGLLVEAIDGIESIKAVGGEWKMLEFWKSLNTKSADREFEIRSTSTLATIIPQALQQLSYVLMIAVGAYAITTGNITMGAMVACSIISNRALSPISQIAGKIIQWHHAKAALVELDNMMKLESDREENIHMFIPEKCSGHIRTEGISFTYSKDNNPALNASSFNVNPSEKIAIIGPVGAGKSTLIKLLSGLYKPAQGKVFLDEVDMSHIAPEFLRESIGYLTQDVRLFNGSLRYNLTLGLATPPDSKIIDACKKTGLINIIKNHPKGLDLPIYEGGRGLSGGQKQLVGLTRMLIAKPKVLLLDEPTASMDGDLELKVMQSIFSAADPYSVIILSTHKLGLLNFVDRIIVLDRGKVAFDGPKEEVLSKLKNATARSTQPRT